MTYAAILNAVLLYGPSIIPLIQKLVVNVQAGKNNENVTPEDWAELTRLASLSSSTIYARLGIAMPVAS